MPSMTEDMGRLANAIAASRRQRAEARIVRGQAVVARGRDVEAMLEAMTKARAMMARDYHKEMAAIRRHRHREVATLFRQFAHDHDMRRRHRAEAAAAEGAELAAFMRDLTARVAAMRDGFAKSQKARTAACQHFRHTVERQLAAFTRDRHGAAVTWRSPSTPAGMMHSGRPARHRAGGAMMGAGG